VSDMKRAAQALVQTRVERFESLHALAESKARLAAAFARTKIEPGASFDAQWSESGGRAVLEARFLPPGGIHGLLRAISVAMLVLLAASVYEIVAVKDGAARFLLPLATLLVILGFPIFTLALNSQREARESRIVRAIRVALLDADEGFPPQQRWSDEE